MKRGKFITIEGVEGGGKSTNIAYIAKQLDAAGIEYILTREPGGTEVAEVIRSILLDSDLPAMHEDTELLLMFAARAEHLQKKILPALAAGKWVICDRFTDSSYAYQSGGRGIAIERIATLENWVQGELRPDITLLFDLNADVGLARTRIRGEADRFEKEAVDFFNAVRQQYLTMAKQYPERYRLINAQQDLPEVQQQVQKVLDELLT